MYIYIYSDRLDTKDFIKLRITEKQLDPIANGMINNRCSKSMMIEFALF